MPLLFLTLTTYSRSQNNVNVVYCNYKEITSSFSVITKHNMSHSLPNVGIIYNFFFETLKKHVIFKIVTVIRSTSTSKSFKLCNYSNTTL